METKNNPGNFDCYANAGPDEQMFVLLDRDPLAPFLVSIWSKMRMGDFEAARVVFEAMIERRGGRYLISPDVDKASEAMGYSMAMFRAQEARQGPDNEPDNGRQTPSPDARNVTHRQATSTG